MEKIIPTLVLGIVVAGGCLAQTTNPPVSAFPNFAQLTNGMTLVEFRKTLGTLGRQEENPSPVESFFDFDFNGEWIMAVVQTHPTPAVVKQFRLIKDGLTIEERQVQRRKHWSEWVANRSRKRTNAVPNKASEAIAPQSGAQPQR